MTTNPEAIKILHDIKHHSKIFENAKINDKIGEIFAIYHKGNYLTYNHLLEIGQKNTNNQIKNCKKNIKR